MFHLSQNEKRNVRKLSRGLFCSFAPSIVHLNRVRIVRALESIPTVGRRWNGSEGSLSTQKACFGKLVAHSLPHGPWADVLKRDLDRHNPVR